MELDDFEFSIVSAETTIPPFRCTDPDLNEFLLNDAKKYLAELMAETYIFVDTEANKTVAYFTLLNDKIAYDLVERRIWNRLNRGISNNKRRKSYPSVKIGRLAVSEEYEGNHLGSAILDLIKGEFAYGARTGGRLVTGCRYITVDAYAKAAGFYHFSRGGIFGYAPRVNIKSKHVFRKIGGGAERRDEIRIGGIVAGHGSRHGQITGQPL